MTTVIALKDWKEKLTEQFSHPCYNGEVFTMKDMLDQYLGMAHHGWQHGDCKIKFTVIDGFKHLLIELAGDESQTIPLSDLATLGYIPEPNEKAVDFLDTHWNMY